MILNDPFGINGTSGHIYSLKKRNKWAKMRLKIWSKWIFSFSDNGKTIFLYRI